MGSLPRRGQSCRGRYAGIIIVSEFRGGDSESGIDDVGGDVAVTGHAACEPAVSPGVGLGYPDGVLAFLAVDRKEYFHGAARKYFYAGVGVFLNVGAVVSGRFQSPFLEVILYDFYSFRHAGRSSKASFQCRVGELLDVAEQFV